MKYLAVLIVFVSLAFAPVHGQAQSSQLTPALLDALLNFVAKKGTDRELDTVLASRLGLSAPGQGWASRQVAGLDPENGVYHGIAVSQSDKDIAFSLLRPNSLHAFRVHRDGKIVTAVIMDRHTGQFTTPFLDEAQKEVDAEFSYWAQPGK